MHLNDSFRDCPVMTVARIIGSKGKILILYRLLDRSWRFNELKRDIATISPKVLTENLRSLEADGLVVRTVHNIMPPHVEYALSELGQSMRPLLQEMQVWGISYLNQIEKSR